MTGLLFRRFLFSKRSGSLIRVIAWLCLSGVVIGVAALVVVLSVMNGFNNTIRNKMVEIEPHLVVADKSIEDLSSFLQNYPEIRAEGFESQDVILRTYEGLFNGAVAKGVSQKSLNALAGRSSLEAVELKPDEIVMGADLAKTLGLYQGDFLMVIPPEALMLPPGEAPPVVKVKIHSLLISEVQEIDSNYIFYTRGSHLSYSKNVSLSSGVELYLQNPSEFSDQEKELLALGYKVQNWQERNSALFFALKMEKVVMTTFLSLSALIASFSIFSLMVLLIVQKGREVGLLMAIGLSPGRALRLWMGIGQRLSFLGLGGGLVLGIVVSLLLEAFPLNVLPADVYYDSAISARVDFVQISWIGLGCIVVAVFASIIPVIKQVRLNPSEALRAQNG